jgi:hypothetical protein
LQSVGWRYHYVVHECHGGTYIATVYDGALPVNVHRDATLDARTALIDRCEEIEHRQRRLAFTEST